MVQDRIFTILSVVFVFTILNLSGCATTIKLPNLSYDIIRSYKTVTIYANRSRANRTAVTVEKGVFYSLIASGRVGTSKMNRPQAGYEGARPEQKLGVMIDTDYQVVPPINATIAAPADGEIRLVVEDYGFIPEYGYAKYNSKYYQDNTGSFEVTIIAWKTKKLDHIVDFFEQFKLLNPENEVAEKLLAQAQSLRTSLGQVKIASDETKSQLQEISTKPSSISAKDRDFDDQVQDVADSSSNGQQVKSQQETVGDSGAAIEPGDLYSPLMLIVSPGEMQTTSTTTIQLIGVVEDDIGLQEVEITINEKPLALGYKRGISIDFPESKKRYEFNERIPVSLGTNRIKIHATDLSGHVSEKTIVVNREELRREVWAVVVGIDKYPKLQQLKYAVKDAQAFYDLLLSSNYVSSGNIFFVTNDQAKLSNLRSILGTKLKQKAGQDDMVIIYFAGHGATERDTKSPDGDGLEKYLLPYDADPDDLYASALPMREISFILNRISSERLVFIADSCYSGASGGRTVSIEGIRANISDSFINRIAEGKGRIIMTASAANEVSAEDDTLQHGIFTYYLIEGLRGRADYDSDGLVTVDEAYRYVSEEVPRATAQEQHPVKKGSVEGQLVLGIVN